MVAGERCAVGVGYAPDAAAGLRVVFVRELRVSARLGIHAHEAQDAQPVRISLEALVRDDSAPDGIGEDRLRRVVDYAALCSTARRMAEAGHTRLAETLAEKIAVACLAEPRILRIRVMVEKPAILPDVTSVGVWIERTAGAYFSAATHPPGGPLPEDTGGVKRS
jgi:7,8-dihydroneopterin aldolase/epimerase/oxygenase